MQRHISISSAIVLVILGGAIFYAATRPVPAKAPGATTGVDAMLPSDKYVEHAAYYDIAANYASSTPLQGAANTTAVKLMQTFVLQTIEQFKADGNFANLRPEDITNMGFDKGRRETLQIVYLVASSVNTISYIYTVYEDTLGAHGNSYFRAFTFDTKTGAPLALSDVFLPGSDYLAILSSISRSKLPAIIDQGYDANFVNSGTTPEDKNFSNFFFDNRDFVVLFAPYAVAPYSSGPQTLRIPISDLADTLKPEYR